ncbi:MAG: lysylphosphatidylglycerol synthase transmembrane domain-containing protein [Acidimicrobiales bacterium]
MTTAADARDPTEIRNFFFAAPADDPRARRPADWFVLATCVVVVLLASWTHRAPSDFDARVLDYFSERLPGWLSATLAFSFALGALYSFGLLAAIFVFGKGRRAVARDMVYAVGLSLGVAILFSWLVGGQWPELIPEIAGRDGAESFPVLRLTLAFALVSVAGPYLSLPMRKVGRRLLAVMIVAAVMLSYGTISAVVSGVALGVGSASIVRLLFGSGVGIPSKDRVAAALSRSGIDVVSLSYLDPQPVGTTLMRAQLGSDRSALVKVYGRDASDAALASRLWRKMWYTDLDRSLTATGLQQVEHESLMLLEAERRNAPGGDLIGWGRGGEGDAFVVTSWPEGPALSEATVDQRSLAGCWAALIQLHRAGLAHRKIDPSRLHINGDTVVFDDLSGATASPTQASLAADIAQLLVTTAVVSGAERAVSAALTAIGEDRLLEAFPLVQRTALSSDLQAHVKAADLDLKELRSVLAGALKVESTPELAQLQRVSWGNVAMIVLTLFAASALISSLADIGFDTIVEEFSDARWSWVVTAFVLAQMTNLTEYVSLTGMISRPVPFGPTIMFRYSLAFISLAVPSEAGSIAMNIRYMRKLGVPAASAVAQGPLLTVVAKTMDILLLLLAGRIIGESITLDDFDSGPVLRLILLVVVLVVIGVLVTLLVPKLRNRILPPVLEAFEDVKESITDPERLMRILGGALVGRLLFAATLSASVSAFGGSVTFSEAVFVNSAVGLFVGLMPVPGGIGVGEAALTAGLTLVGVPESTAFAAALTHRMVTSYLPPVYGFFTTRWLTERDYL